MIDAAAAAPLHVPRTQGWPQRSTVNGPSLYKGKNENTIELERPGYVNGPGWEHDVLPTQLPQDPN